MSQRDKAAATVTGKNEALNTAAAAAAGLKDAV